MKLLGFSINRSKPGRKTRRAVRGFDAAKADRLFAGWATTGDDVDTDIANGLSQLRARSRDQFLNNDFARRYVEMVRANIVGPNGVVFQSAALDSNGNIDRQDSDAIEKAFNDWARAEHCDLEERTCWKEKQRQAAGTAAIDGEILARTYTGPSYGKYGFMVQHLDAALLNEEYNKNLAGGNFIRMGIEYDQRKRAVAYHLLVGSNAAADSINAGKRYRRIPANQIIHTFDPIQTGQSRGYPWMATGLGSLKMLDAYFEAALTAARAGASKMGFIQSADGAAFSGDDVDDDGSVISDFEAGIIEQLPEGMTFNPFDPKYPHELFENFTKVFLQRFASGGGVSYSGVSGNLEGVNFSSIRAGVLEEREMCKIRQEWFIEGYCRPIFERWLTAALLGGHITVQGRPLPADKEEKFRRATWQARRWAWVDPSKDTNSRVTQIENNLTTVSAVIREQGQDPDEVFQERSKELARMKELGLTDEEVIENGQATE